MTDVGTRSMTHFNNKQMATEPNAARHQTVISFVRDSQYNIVPDSGISIPDSRLSNTNKQRTFLSQSKMTENQRLQRFAALCAGQSDAPTDETRDAKSDGVQMGESQISIASALSSPSSSSAATQQSQHAQDAARKSHPSVQNTQQLQNMNAQQLQQALARAAFHGTVSPSLAAAQGFVMQAGLSTQQITDVTMAQIAIQQYLQQAQQAFATQQASQTMSSTNGVRESQALMMAALAGGKVNPFGHVTGKKQLHCLQG